MAEIINLRRARKAKARAGAQAQAAENRARFGRTKAQKRLADAQERLAERHVAAHRREDEPEA
jgi:hypothetical protein